MSSMITAFCARFVTDLPRRSIRITAFAVMVVGVMWLAMGSVAGLMIFTTGCYFMAHPFDRTRLADVLAEIVRRRYGGSP